eukprot:TRINITY_DN12658_c0_g1_i7.p2 TRINITY_DN12658_c0_g1~~TRINITY_DN12658_c0_g1_i7.p2  ORF type:complete len:231 (-),score=15.99 TRINITY_DN12658_c0_g1_i7:1165-1764(-)
MVVFTLFKPGFEQANDALKDAKKPNYSEVAQTKSESLTGYQWMIDSHKIQLGKGKKTYQTAKEALENWEQLQLDWVNVPHANAIPLEPGQRFVISGRTLGVWTSNPLEVTYKYENSKRVDKKRINVFGVGSSTLNGHLLAGEESFRIEWDRSDNSVWYKIYTFSKPSHPLAVLAYPIVRLQQSRFCRDSKKKMLELTSN